MKAIIDFSKSRAEYPGEPGPSDFESHVVQVFHALGYRQAVENLMFVSAEGGYQFTPGTERESYEILESVELVNQATGQLVDVEALLDCVELALENSGPWYWPEPETEADNGCTDEEDDDEDNDDYYSEPSLQQMDDQEIETQIMEEGLESWYAISKEQLVDTPCMFSICRRGDQVMMVVTGPGESCLRLHIPHSVLRKYLHSVNPVDC